MTSRTLAGVGLLLVVAAAPVLGQCPDSTPPPCRAPAIRAPTPAPNSIAILPFGNRSADTADAYLAEGMTEEITNRLARVGRLQVKGASLAAAQWRRTPDVMEAGRRLGVAWVVEGYVRRAEASLQVTAALLRVTSGEQTWGARFPRGAADVFAVQAEVAESVAVAVVGRLAPAERGTLTRRPTHDNEAYRLYLLGNSLLARRTQLEVRRALAAYTEAARLDPRFTNAWARISLARSIQYSWSGWDEGVPRDSLLSLSWAAANRALSLDSLSAEARLAVAHAAMQRGDGWIARAEFERSLALDSLDPDAWHFYGTMYGPDCVPICYCLDDYERAAPLFRHALTLDPTLRNPWRWLALAARDAGRLADAEALLDTALSFGPWNYARWNRAYVRLARGNASGALADLSEASGIDPVDLLRTQALVAAALGDSTPARLALSGLRESTGADPGATWWKARLAMALGLRGEALEALEGLRGLPIVRALLCAPSVPCSAHLATWIAVHDPIFAPLRGHPRFERLWEETRPRVPWLEGHH